MQNINVILQKIEIAIGVISILLILIITLLNIVFRYFLNNPLAWAEEVSTFCLVWLGHVTAAYILSKEEHINFSYIFDRLPSKLNKILRVMFNILIIMSLIALFPSVLRNFAFMRESPALKINMAFIYIIVPITYGIMIFHTIVNIVDLINKCPKQKKG